MFKKNLSTTHNSAKKGQSGKQIHCIVSNILGGGLIKYTVLIKYTGVIKYTVRKPILSVEICEIKYTVFVYIFLTKKFFQQVLHKKSKKNFFDFGGPDSVRAVMGSLCAEKRVFLT